MSQVVIRLLPDGSGRVRIHYFVHDETGAAKTAEGSLPSNMGPLPVGGTRGFIACQPRQSNVAPAYANGKWLPCCHSDDPRGVTCPECQATPEYKKAAKEIAEMAPVQG